MDTGGHRFLSNMTRKIFYLVIFGYIWSYLLLMAGAETQPVEGLAKDGRDDNDAPATGRAVIPANVD